MHQCYAETDEGRCPEQIQDALLMCRSHWARVPDLVQRRVYTTYRADPMSDEAHEARQDARWAVRTSYDPPMGSKVRVLDGDYSGRKGMYEGRSNHPMIEGHRVFLDGDHTRDPAITCSRVEAIE